MRNVLLTVALVLAVLGFVLATPAASQAQYRVYVGPSPAYYYPYTTYYYTPRDYWPGVWRSYYYAPSYTYSYYSPPYVTWSAPRYYYEPVYPVRYYYYSSPYCW
jgi:hypothetical protein